MTAKTRKPIPEALAETTGPLARKVLEYSLIYKRLTDQAKHSGSGITAAEWGPLAELVAVDEFERVGIAKEVMNWRQYTEFLSGYANASSWDGSFRRITEVPGLVFLELEERGAKVDGSDPYVVNTMTVYEFNEAGKLRHLDVYLQGAV